MARSSHHLSFFSFFFVPLLARKKRPQIFFSLLRFFEDGERDYLVKRVSVISFTPFRTAGIKLTINFAVRRASLISLLARMRFWNCV